MQYIRQIIMILHLCLTLQDPKELTIRSYWYNTILYQKNRFLEKHPHPDGDRSVVPVFVVPSVPA